jgi:serine/threonine protein kinase
VKVGEVLNGYRIQTAPTNTGGGMSQWSFAEKDGQPYFVKMFLSPKYPLDHGPGSPASKARKRKVCLEFERRHLEIAGRLDPSEPGGGNLVVPRDFFRVDSTYVKVMDRIDATPMPAAHTLTGHQLIVILRTLVFSLRLLHGKHIVHGDIKPDNVLLLQTAEGMFVSKLIDFDEAYVVGQPPLPEHIVGDPVYYAPELLRYIKRDPSLPADAMFTASDIFSLGLLIHALLVGDVPAFDRSKAKYPAEALIDGQSLDVSAAPIAIRPLLTDALRPRPQDRPAIEDVIEFLTHVEPDQLVPSATAARTRPTPSVVPPSSATGPASTSGGATPAARPGLRSSVTHGHPRTGPAPTTGPATAPPGAAPAAATPTPPPGATPTTPPPGAAPSGPDDEPRPPLRISMGRRPKP